MSPVSPCANPQGYEQSASNAATQCAQVASPGGPRNAADSADCPGVASDAVVERAQALMDGCRMPWAQAYELAAWEHSV